MIGTGGNGGTYIKYRERNKIDFYTGDTLRATVDDSGLTAATDLTVVGDLTVQGQLTGTMTVTGSFTVSDDIDAVRRFSTDINIFP